MKIQMTLNGKKITEEIQPGCSCWILCVPMGVKV